MTELTELQQINKEASKFYNYEQAVKLMLNSIYGAFGNKWFHFFNIDIAMFENSWKYISILYIII